MYSILSNNRSEWLCGPTIYVVSHLLSGFTYYGM